MESTKILGSEFIRSFLLQINEQETVIRPFNSSHLNDPLNEVLTITDTLNRDLNIILDTKHLSKEEKQQLRNKISANSIMQTEGEHFSYYITRKHTVGIIIYQPDEHTTPTEYTLYSTSLLKLIKRIYKEAHNTEDIPNTIIENAIKLDYKTLKEDLNNTYKEQLLSAKYYTELDKSSAFDRKINEIDDNINKILTKLTQLKNDREAVLINKIKAQLSQNGDEFKNFINFLLKSPLIKRIGIYKDTISNDIDSINIDTIWLPVDYIYAQERATKLTIESPLKKGTKYISEIHNALTSQSEYKILTAPVSIRLSGFNNQKIYWEIVAPKLAYANPYSHSSIVLDENINQFRNTHYFEYHCLGGFLTDIETASIEKKLITLVVTLLQYIQTINLSDYAGEKWLNKKLLIKNLKTNEVFILDEKKETKTPLNAEDLKTQNKYSDSEKHTIYSKENINEI